MTVLEHDPYIDDNIDRGIESRQGKWQVSKGDAGWTDRQITATLLGAAAGALGLAISLLISLNKLRS